MALKNGMVVCHIFRLDFPNVSLNPMKCRCSRSEHNASGWPFHFEPPGRMSWTCDLLAGKTTKLSLSQSRLEDFDDFAGCFEVERGSYGQLTRCTFWGNKKIGGSEKAWRIRGKKYGTSAEFCCAVPFLLLALWEPCDLRSGVKTLHIQCIRDYRSINHIQWQYCMLLYSVLTCRESIATYWNLRSILAIECFLASLIY